MKTLVAGIGSPILSDDGVGIHVVRRLSHMDVLEVGTAGLSLLDCLSGYRRLIIVDAIVSGKAPGTLTELDGDQIARTVHLGAGHEADFPTTLAVGKKLLGREMPEEIVVLAVEAGDLTTFSERPTPAVEAAIDEVVSRILEICSS